MLFDFSVPDISKWRVFYQARPGEEIEGEVYINGGKLGHDSYSPTAITANTNYRLVVVYEGSGDNHLYLDGESFFRYNGYGEATKKLMPTIRFLTDGWGGYDHEMTVSTIAIWDRALSAAEIKALDKAE
jgi:hypothetical protein